MNHLSLFSGVGGIDIAAHLAGFKTVQFVEKDPFCQRVLAKNFPGVPIHDDITTFDGRRYRGVELVSGGFPCQPHSVAGKRKASRDERDLWGETVRVLGEAQPRWFLGENVPGLLSSESGRFFGRVVNDLAALGFRVGWCVYGASDVGACHRRKRVFIVAYSEKLFGNGGNTQSKRGTFPELGNGDSLGISPNSEGEQDRRREFAGFSSNVSANVPPDSPSVRRKYRELPSRDWRTWDIKPVFRSGDDGVPDYVVRHRVNILKALGNAVCPQQCYPILKAIAEAA